MQYFSNESKAEEAQDLCNGMSEFLDTLRSEQARRVTSTQRAFMVSKSYIPLRIRVTSMCWIVKASTHLSHTTVVEIKCMQPVETVEIIHYVLDCFNCMYGKCKYYTCILNCKTTCIFFPHFPGCWLCGLDSGSNISIL